MFGKTKKTFKGKRDNKGRKFQMMNRRKSCRFCIDKKLKIDYKEPKFLQVYISERGRILPRRLTGTCAKHQRELTTAIKRARILAFIPFTAAQVATNI